MYGLKHTRLKYEWYLDTGICRKIVVFLLFLLCFYCVFIVFLLCFYYIGISI